MGKGQELYRKAKSIIPGGTQLLSKRPEMFLPDFWPTYYQSAKGCELWDLDGNKYIDMSYMAIGASILGYADEDVNRITKSVIDKGICTTLNALEEVELADLLCELHPWADMARFARTGGEAMAIAVRIARAVTGKDKILFCGYHGWHDWYLAANLADEKALDGHLLSGLEPNGVPRALKGTALPFLYNDTEGFQRLIRDHQDEVGVVVLESIRNYPPEEKFLKTIREITKKLGIVLVFDEITSGWRLNVGGAHLVLGVNPDIAVFAKGISNGVPMAAIIGTSEVMNAAQTSFISSTNWTERLGPAAALATIRKMKEYNVPAHLIKAGQQVKKGWQECADRHGLTLSISGIDPLGHFEFPHEKPLVLKTLFTQLMLERGFLATNAFYASFAHKEEHVDKYIEAVDQSFAIIAEAMERDSIQELLKGEVSHSGFKRLT